MARLRFLPTAGPNGILSVTNPSKRRSIQIVLVDANFLVKLAREWICRLRGILKSYASL